MIRIISQWDWVSIDFSYLLATPPLCKRLPSRFLAFRVSVEGPLARDLKEVERPEPLIRIPGARLPEDASDRLGLSRSTLRHSRRRTMSHPIGWVWLGSA
jgi:hypothetical protein